MAHADLAPALPAQHRGCVQQHDPLHLGLGAGVQPGARAGAQPLDRVGRAGRRHHFADAHADVLLDRLEHGGEQLGLVGELVVQGAARHARRAHDRLGAHAAEPVLGEQGPRGVDQRGARGGGAVELGAAVDVHTDSMYLTCRLYVKLLRGADMPTIDLPNGTVNYRVEGPEDSAAPPVVFVHGFLVDGTLWSKTAAALAEQGIRSYAPDWPLGSHPIALDRGRGPVAAGHRPPHRLLPRGAGPGGRDAGGQRHRRRHLPVRAGHRRLAHRPAGADQLRRVRQLPAGAVRHAVQVVPQRRGHPRADGAHARHRRCATPRRATGCWPPTWTRIRRARGWSPA